MTPPVYPARVTPINFFSPLPRPLWALLADGRLARRDIAVLGVLLDYKGKGTTVVFPGQRTLAERLDCSVDTVQRGLRRLVEAGLIAKQYVRDALGRLRGVSYDLTAVLQMMPSKTAKLRQGEWGAPDGQNRIERVNAPAPKPQACGTEGEDKKDVVQADNSDPAEADAAAGLTSAGVRPDVAVRLVRQFGVDACRRQREWLAGRRNVRDRAAALVASIRQGWAAPTSVPVTRPAPPPRPAPESGSVPAPSVRPFVPRPAAAADPLDELGAEELARLERVASEAVCRAMPGLAPLVASGRAERLVREHMRRLAREGSR